MYYLHNDHLGTPRAMTDTHKKVVWRWDSDPFGATAANDDPDNDGVKVTMNLRFLGQYFDAESGLHFNWNRYYDPVLGRYITSDPIGLRGGLNTYGYVDGNPLRFFDIFGLAKSGDVVFFNWNGSNHPRHAAIISQVDASGNATHAFGAWGDNRAFHEVDLNVYNGGVTGSIIGYGDMTGLNSSDLNSTTWDWFGRPIGIDPTIDDWSGYYGPQCIDATTTEDGFGGSKLRDAMRDDFNKDPSKYKPIPGDKMRSSDQGVRVIETTINREASGIR